MRHLERMKSRESKERNGGALNEEHLADCANKMGSCHVPLGEATPQLPPFDRESLHTSHPLVTTHFTPTVKSKLERYSVPNPARSVRTSQVEKEPQRLTVQPPEVDHPFALSLLLFLPWDAVIAKSISGFPKVLDPSMEDRSINGS